MTARVLCVDVGSTFTKAALVDTAGGTLLATGAVPTTVETDVMDGYRELRGELGARRGDRALACSSAGGGLRLVVVGYERAITAGAGHRVGLSAGARVAHVSAGRLDRRGLAELFGARPDVVLLVGGTDGGNSEVLLYNAGALGGLELGCPVVVAGNVAVRTQVCELLAGRGRTVVPASNVLPEIGVLCPEPAREALRAVFLTHVIGGKGLSRGPAFARMVRAATPDAVLRGVQVLAEGVGDVLVVDVGGATTDVYSVVAPDAEQQGGQPREAVGTMPASRTVEGDLGIRWNAVGIVDAALAERLLDPPAEPALRTAAVRRAADPAYIPDSTAEADVDLRLAGLAVTVALRRHARGVDGRGGRDLRRVRLVVGSGSVFRHGDERRAAEVLARALDDRSGGWRVPKRAAVTLDRRYVLAAAGLLSLEDQQPAAAGLLRRCVDGRGAGGDSR